MLFSSVFIVSTWLNKTLYIVPYLCGACLAVSCLDCPFSLYSCVSQRPTVQCRFCLLSHGLRPNKPCIYLGVVWCLPSSREESDLLLLLRLTTFSGLMKVIIHDQLAWETTYQTPRCKDGCVYFVFSVNNGFLYIWHVQDIAVRELSKGQNKRQTSTIVSQRLCLNGCVSTVMSQLEASAKNYNRSDTCDSYIEMTGNSNPRCNVNLSPELWLGSTVSN